MKEWNALMEYIDEFIYDSEEEEIVIRHSEKADIVLGLYQKALDCIKEDIESPDSGSYKSEKFQFDVALDCVKNLKEDDRNYLLQHLYYMDFHHGYGMFIRNQYLWGAKKHRVFMADEVSGDVMIKMFSILEPDYDYRNKEIVSYFESNQYYDLFRMYGETELDIFESNKKKLFSGEIATSDSALNILRSRLYQRLGQEEFTRLLKNAMKEFYEQEGRMSWDGHEWFWGIHFPNQAILFPLEVKQFKCLNLIGLLHEIDFMSIRSESECKQYIDEKLGLKEQYASFMAKAVWEACDPLSTGLWKKMYFAPRLDIDFFISQKLEKQEIETFADLCDTTYEELYSILEDEDKVDSVCAELAKLGLSLKVE